MISRRFAEHAEDAFFVGELRDFFGGEPGDVVRFVAARASWSGVGDQQETHVVVFVGVFDHAGRLRRSEPGFDARRVERHQRAVDRHEVEAGHARFLAGFAEGDFVDVPLAVGVAAELQPAVELAVMREQAAAAVGREDPGGAGDVARPAGAVEAIGVRFDERADAIDDGRFGRERSRGSGPACRATAGGAWGGGVSR